ncbi:MAG: inorganic phosphate transporter [Candidatus Thiodiazotropha sp.]|jgi:inorganic phosphate transporter, PiT family
MELEKIAEIEQATWVNRKELLRLGVAFLFIVGIMLFVGSKSSSVSHLLVVAGMIGGYMAMNIGANDVANNVGPAVGSRAITLTGAILIAAIFEAMGALVAGGEVVGTIKKGIIDPALINDTDTFIWLMMGALLAGALWLNLATILGAPVSTTHSIVGGVLGAGIAAGGWDIANWSTMGQIVLSWVISPVLGGIIAAAFLYLIKRTITYQSDMLRAATRMVPILIGVMAWAFSTYLALKGFKKLWKIDPVTALGIGCVAGVLVTLIVSPLIKRLTVRLQNDKKSVNRLFTVPLIFAAAMLSFAHGANDVANAIGPLAAINDALTTGGISSKATIPLWVMMVGALGISIGLALYGPKLIRTVGSEITELDQIRAFCIALAAAITVIIATQFGLPVSSTHIAVGAIFGVGFLREFLKTNYLRMVEEIEMHHQGADREDVENFMEAFQKSSIEEKAAMLKQLKEHKSKAGLTKKERKGLKKVYHHELVKRSAFLRIVAAWIITVPTSAMMAALLFYMIRGMMLP